MKHEDILTTANHKSGMTVPPDYFADFSAKMAKALPEQPWEKEPQIMPRTLWQKVRPYIYMAAMFLGIWCMMNMFDLMQPTSDMTIDNNSVITAAVNNETFFENYIVPTVDENALLDDLYEEGFDSSDFEL